VENWFQAFAFKCNLYRYSTAGTNQGLGGGISPSDRLTGARYQQGYAALRPAATALELRLVAALAEELYTAAEVEAKAEGGDPTKKRAAVPYPSAADVRAALEGVPHPDELDHSDGEPAALLGARAAEAERSAASAAERAAAAEAAGMEEEAARLTAAKRRAGAAAGSFDVYLSDVTTDSSDDDADDPPAEGGGTTRSRPTRLKTDGPSSTMHLLRKKPSMKKLLVRPSGDSVDSLSDSDPDSPGRPPTPRSSIATKDSSSSKLDKFFVPAQSTIAEERRRERAPGDETESEDEGPTGAGAAPGAGVLMSPRSQKEGPPPPPLPFSDADDGDSTASEDESDDDDE
jgi:hypothetical protein